MTLANLSNGIVIEHDDICYFQSNYGHSAKLGYFRHDAMPLKAIAHLLTGGKVRIVDATRRTNRLSDALRFGVPTWCMVFNRAIRKPARVCEWETLTMQGVANSKLHSAHVQTIRKLAKMYGSCGPAVIGSNVELLCVNGVDYDDRPEIIRNDRNRWRLTSTGGIVDMRNVPNQYFLPL